MSTQKLSLHAMHSLEEASLFLRMTMLQLPSNVAKESGT
jgi:hypothetical protein